MKHRALTAAILVLVFAGGVAAQSPEIEELLAAAEQGDPDAQYKLGLKYAFSAIDAALALLPYDYQKALIYTEDYQEAVKWYRLAAEQGKNVAQFELGAMYTNGKGVPQDFVQAHKWINLAASQNTAHRWFSYDTATAESYRLWRDEVAERMTAKQIAEAQRLAREWQPKTWEQLKDE